MIEFKSGTADTLACIQVEDYALDLADFHAESRLTGIVPMVVSARCGFTAPQVPETRHVQHVEWCCAETLSTTIAALFSRYSRPSGIQIDLDRWNQATYNPVPTIVEAAQAIFSGMEVREIAHAHCDPHNLTKTVDALVSTIADAMSVNKKIICFVTGVPGSGKTLAGLRAVHDQRIRDLTGTDPAFFSGNGPLVRVLREALVQDAVQRGDTAREARRRMLTTIQNVHVLAREAFDDPQCRAPHERIMVFDEAQRAWNAVRNHRKFKRNISESEMILSIMDRHGGWAVLICLVGGGQEIHDGEAGLAAWGQSIADKFRHWQVRASPEALRGGPSVAGTTLFASYPPGISVVEDPVLHLGVSTRSYRAQAITDWSNALLEGQILLAASTLARGLNFPVYLTRDLTTARLWLKSQTRGTARCGLVASSGAARLRADGIETSTAFHRDYPYEFWFLKPASDVRSAYRLEVVATEFEIQGLELDWVGLCWGGDFLWNSEDQRWHFRNFMGTKWRRVSEPESQRYLTNSYRVLLTRARQGMVIWIPRGDPNDPTREPKLFDMTAEVLSRAGLKWLEEDHAAHAVEP